MDSNNTSYRDLSSEEYAEQYWEAKMSEPIENHEIPEEILDRLKKKGWV